jgi:hypothetical protein
MQVGLDQSTIVVLDNASDQVYKSAFESDQEISKALEAGKVVIVRHANNIGMAANFMRAFELSSTPWLWMLSDDDDVMHDALPSVLRAIDSWGKDVGYLRFSSPRSEPISDSYLVDSFEKFIDLNCRSKDDFNSFIFLSNGVYRLGEFRRYIEVGYSYLNTYVPHFMMLAHFMASGNRCLILKKEIVRYVVPTVGYSYGLVAGLGVGAPKHSIFNLSRAYDKKFQSIFYPHNDFKVIIDIFFNCKMSATTYVCWRLSSSYVSYVSPYRPIYKRFFLSIFSVLVLFPSIFEILLLIGEHASIKVRKHIAEIRIRYIR